MSSVTRHPSSPRKSAVTPREALPVAFCVKCYFLGPALPKDGPGGRFYECPHCGGLELIPPDTQRARDHFGDRYEGALMQAQEAARQFAVEREKALRIHEAQQRAGDAATSRAVLIGLAAVVAIVVLAAAGWWWTNRPAPEIWDANRPIGTPSVPSDEAVLTTDIAGSYVAPQPERLTISTAGFARARPSSTADPVMRVTAGETYRRGEERDGWVRLGDAPVEAWVETTAAK